MTDRSASPAIAGLAVTLLTASRPQDGELVARLLAGATKSDAPSAIKTPDDDPVDFALVLAERLVDDVVAGRRGNTVVLLDPEADVVETALITEYLLESHRPALPVGIRDVVAVSSVHEIIEVLYTPTTAGEDSASPDSGVDYSSAGRLASRLEFASIVVLTDVLDNAIQVESALVQTLVAKLAPLARVLSLGDLAKVRSQDAPLVRGRAYRLGASMGWQLELAEDAIAEPVGDEVGSVVFRDPRPFHPVRLHDAILTQLTPGRVGRIVRSRGFVTLASRPNRVGSWSTAGDVLDLDPTAMVSWDPESPVGQEIVFFGINLDQAALQDTLADCVLNGTELLDGPKSWASCSDPFPEWATHHH
jgi:G3E family GTPase